MQITININWILDDHRLFVGNLGNEVNDDVLLKAFLRYPSLLRAKVIRDKRSSKTRGYGFVSFRDAKDFARAVKEMNGMNSFSKSHLMIR